eukprot:12745186-Alexandrium_andersonii.AAC.1
MAPRPSCPAHSAMGVCPGSLFQSPTRATGAATPRDTTLSMTQRCTSSWARASAEGQRYTFITFSWMCPR